MFDWSEPTHTSPTSTSLTMIGALPFLPVMVMVKGPPDFSFASRPVHLPSASAIADLVWSWNFTVIFSPGSAMPQTGSAMSLCNTMWSLNRPLGNLRACRPSKAQRGAEQCRAQRCPYEILEWLHLQSPFSALVRPTYTALQQYGKTNAAIAVEKLSESVPAWTRPHN